MKAFLFGILAAILGLLVGGYLYFSFGLLNPSAIRGPSRFESTEAMKFLDAAVERHAPKQVDPFGPSAGNLREGLRIYQAHCAVCHGDRSSPRSAVGLGLYPPAPEFLENAPDMPEYQNFYIIRNGIRWSGMPSWNKLLSEEQMWKLTLFLSHIDHLPPAVEQEWKHTVPAKARATAARAQGENRHE